MLIAVKGFVEIKKTEIDSVNFDMDFILFQSFYSSIIFSTFAIYGESAGFHNLLELEITIEIPIGYEIKIDTFPMSELQSDSRPSSEK